MQALLIIDMQVGSFEGGQRYDADGLVARLNALSGSVRAGGGLVAFIQHDGPVGDPHHPDQPGWRLLPTLRTDPSDAVVRKTACDAFLDTNLDALLTERGVTEVIVTGCATDYCVDTTIRSALARGYATLVPIDGHTTADRPHLPAVKIIQHHNAIWSDFIAPAGPATLTSCAALTRA